jgi:hypothetical protein
MSVVETNVAEDMTILRSVNNLPYASCCSQGGPVASHGVLMTKPVFSAAGRTEDRSFTIRVEER